MVERREKVRSRLYDSISLRSAIVDHLWTASRKLNKMEAITVSGGHLYM